MSRFLAVFFTFLSAGAAPPQILTNQLGYDPRAPKRAVVRGVEGDRVTAFEVRTYPDGASVLQGEARYTGPVDKWKNWRFWTIDFSRVESEGTYVIDAQAGDRTVRSFPFRIQKNILERFTLSDVLFYFKGQRASGEYDKADRHLAFRDSDRQPVDVHGGWYDASGDYGMHLSHLDYSTYFNPQQTPLTVFTLGRTLELIEARKDTNFRQILIRLADELAYGADFLVRMRNPGGSFYETIDGYAENKSPAARRIARTARRAVSATALLRATRTNTTSISTCLTRSRDRIQTGAGPSSGFRTRHGTFWLWRPRKSPA